MSHTPGPWRAEAFDAVDFPHWWRVVRTDQLSDPVADKCGEDDARLMAAAPDLLEACHAVVRLRRPNGEPALMNATADVVRAAIASATGTEVSA